ncbi:hypothetical protein HRbin32_01903 [bacterium HR32]|nr:hypothetical protein HRbin32_01903 [bacterium HR32]
MRTAWRTLRTAFWLGWQVESNWTDPLLFALYQVVRPLGGLLILLFMVRAAAGPAAGPALGFLVVGTAFWPAVVAGMQGMAWAVVGDREHWRTLRYVYTAPVSFRAYLVGRALALVASASAAVAVTLLFGWAVLGVPLRLELGELPYFLCAWATGVTGVLALGLATAAGVLCVSGEAWRMPEAVGAALYLVSGALFPVTVLPEPLRQVASALPVSWWLEALRRVWLPENSPQSFPWASDLQVLATLAVLVAAFAACGLLAFGLSERRARQLGILDRETGF